MSLIAPKKSLGLLSLTALVALLAVFAFGNASQVAHAQQEVPVNSSAGVTSDGSFPHIECKWELPDVNSELARIQYGEDDDPNDEPSFPCTRGTAPTPGVKPQQPSFVQNMIQVIPNAEDQPEARRIENWVAVDHPNGVDEIDDVFWKIFHPDGSFKIQIHGTKVQIEDSGDDTANSDDIVDLNDLGSWDQPDTMFGAAYDTGQVDQDAIHAVGWGFYDLVYQRQKALWYGEWQIHKEQLCGEYYIEATAVANGNVDTMWNTIDIICFYHLEIDFSQVNWGTITPGGYKVVPGDTLFDGPNSAYPTVKNTGNSGMQVGVHFTPLVQQNVAGPKVITWFDAAFGKSANVLEWIDPIWGEGTWNVVDPILGHHGGNPNDPNTPYSGEAWFSDSSINQVLCANEVGKLDLSVHPPSVIPAGDYAGTVTVLAAHAPGVCWEGLDGNVSVPNGTPPAGAP